jgi:hypothetical protein
MMMISLLQERENIHNHMSVPRHILASGDADLRIEPRHGPVRDLAQNIYTIMSSIAGWSSYSMTSIVVCWRYEQEEVLHKTEAQRSGLSRQVSIT